MLLKFFIYLLFFCIFLLALYITHKPTNKYETKKIINKFNNESEIEKEGPGTYNAILYSLGYDKDDNDFFKDVSEQSTYHFIREENTLTISWNSDYDMYIIPEYHRNEIHEKCIDLINLKHLSSICSFSSITEDSIEFIVHCSNLDNVALINDLESLLNEVTKIVEPLLIYLDDENSSYWDDEGFYHDD
jgi:hypothetical protein